MNRIDPSIKVVVDKAYITGCDRTKTSYIESELKPILYQNLPLYQFKNELDCSISRLQSSGHYQYIHADLNIKKFDDDDNNFHSDININLKEKSVPYLKFETYVKAKSSSGVSNEVGCEIVGALRNPLGTGDMHKVSYSTNSSGGSREYQISSHFPHALALTSDNSYYSKNLDITLKSSEDDNSYFLKYKQKLSSLIIDVTPGLSFTKTHQRGRGRGLFSAHPSSQHNYQVELTSRDEIPAYGQTLSNLSNPTSSSLMNESNNTQAEGINIDDAILPNSVNNNVNRTRITYPNATVLSQLLPSTKLSLKHIYTVIDTRDCVNTPTTGTFLQSSVEFATPVGTAQFLKTDLQTQHHRSFGPSLFGQRPVLSLSGSLGIILPWRWMQYKISSASSSIYQGSQSTESVISSSSNSIKYNTLTSENKNSLSFIPMSDRYHLGGPLSMRGFQLYGVGYQDSENKTFAKILNNQRKSSTTTTAGHYELSKLTAGGSDVILNDGASMGGVSKCSMLLALSVPVPVETLARAGARAFGFINMGGIGQTSVYDPVHLLAKRPSSLSPLFGSLRVSAGGGFALPLGQTARLELTYSVPLVKSTSDVVKPFQIGVGMTIN